MDNGHSTAIAQGRTRLEDRGGDGGAGGELGATDLFVRRHIGPSDREIAQMLSFLGFESLEKLADARSKDDFGSIVGLQKSLAFNLSGHVLHSLFWQNLSPDGGGKPEGELASAIDEFFGSFDAFRAQLSEATTTVQGSGWGSLAWEPLGQRLYVEQIYDHQGNVGQSGVNLLVFDAWEHAYYLQYLNVRANYVEALWNIVNWPDIAARFTKARKLTLP